MPILDEVRSEGSGIHNIETQNGIWGDIRQYFRKHFNVLILQQCEKNG